MLARLKELNPTLALYDVTDPEFARYGRIVEMDTAEILRVADAMDRPKGSVAYLPSVEAFEALPIHKEITERIFGTLETQTGYCHGTNSVLNATEWHHSSELNIAITPIILILGNRPVEILVAKEQLPFDDIEDLIPLPGPIAVGTSLLAFATTRTLAT